MAEVSGVEERREREGERGREREGGGITWNRNLKFI